MAALALIELRRLDGLQEEAADAFGALGRQCAKRGAVWLAAQAALGVQTCGDERWEPLWRAVRKAMPDERRANHPMELAVGRPRVLWLLTI
jgi:hypothetical protein